MECDGKEGDNELGKGNIYVDCKETHFDPFSIPSVINLDIENIYKSDALEVSINESGFILGKEVVLEKKKYLVKLEMKMKIFCRSQKNYKLMQKLTRAEIKMKIFYLMKNRKLGKKIT